VTAAKADKLQLECIVGVTGLWGWEWGCDAGSIIIIVVPFIVQEA
jgi:hypothetical protein